MTTAQEPVTIVGAGLAGTLMAILLARRGYPVALYERLPDLRRELISAGRSINLALAARGIRALELAGVMERVRPLLIPMWGRMLHGLDGTLSLIPYGQRENEVIWSVSRPGLNQILLDAAEQAGVTLHFGVAVTDANLAQRRVLMRNEASGRAFDLPLSRVIGADGAGSALRRALVMQLGVPCTEDLLAHGYRELTLPAGDNNTHRIHANALHIWPRGGFMLIALPNLDGTFTVTLFLPHDGPESFATLTDRERIDTFFARHFPDAQALMPGLAAEFLAHPTGIMGTVRCSRWSHGNELLLIGDAAHAITPFHGQGMNCAFEDCRVLDALLGTIPDWGAAATAFERERHDNTEAIADMALENYVEMRDTVRDPKFALRQSLSHELERRYPGRFIPRYSMVMFHDAIAYTVAKRRGVIQGEILARLIREADSLDQIDFTAAAAEIEQRLPPL